jgi:hypothetical protein
MQNAADGSQCNINAARGHSAPRVLEERLEGCFAYRAMRGFSDVIEKLLPQPLSCPLWALAMGKQWCWWACLLFSRR